jgi:glycerol-3-phosphate O-acyltransferase/dihydroxyacetone phosphate acyltransferase
MQTQISSGTIYAPSWQTIRVAKLAARMYAPLGTQMTLGDHVRVTRVFADGFVGVYPGMSESGKEWRDEKNTKDDKERNVNGWGSSDDNTTVLSDTDLKETQKQREQLAKDLGVS